MAAVPPFLGLCRPLSSDNAESAKKLRTVTRIHRCHLTPAGDSLDTNRTRLVFPCFFPLYNWRIPVSNNPLPGMEKSARFEYTIIVRSIR